jgi:hypothetical protein
VNFGQNPFSYSIPEGFQAWSKIGSEIEGEKYIKIVQPIKMSEAVTISRT